MRIKVFERGDGAIVVLPLDLHGSFPLDHDGALSEVGDAELDMDCLSPPFVEELGMRGYCIALGDDAEHVMGCISHWTAPVLPG